MEKKLPLRNEDDCVAWLEKSVNEAKEDNTSIALFNARTSTVKTLMRLKELKMKYWNMKSKMGTTIGDFQEFFGAKVAHKQIGRE